MRSVSKIKPKFLEANAPNYRAQFIGYISHDIWICIQSLISPVMQNIESFV